LIDRPRVQGRPRTPTRWVVVAAIGAGAAAVACRQFRQGEGIAGVRQAVEAAAATFRAVFENAQDAIIIVDDEGRFVDANPAVEHVLGATREELLGRRPEEFVAGAEHAVIETLRRRLRERGELRAEYEFELPGGDRRWVEYTAKANFLPGRHLAVFRDCSERRHNQHALEMRAAQQVAIAELSLMALRRTSPGEFMEAAVSRIAETLELEHVAILEDRAGAEKPRVRAGVGDRDMDDAPGSMAVTVRSRDSVWGRLEVRSARPRAFTDQDSDFLRAAANTVGLALGAAADDAELRRRSAEITRLAAARQLIVAEALAAEDRARERISQQLHDELLQSLFVIRQDLAEAGNNPARTDLVVRARDGVHDAIRGLRATVFDIHPVVLERSGLGAAVGAVAQHHVQAGGFNIDVDIESEAAGEHARLLLSLVRELLTNVSRHAGADHAGVRVWREGEDVVLEVSDDGRGIDLAETQSALSRGHIGLASAVQRVEALNGRFELLARPGGGTTARATIPRAGGMD
jgi:PAS domain S-box-containing protein